MTTEELILNLADIRKLMKGLSSDSQEFHELLQVKWEIIEVLTVKDRQVIE